MNGKIGRTNIKDKNEHINYFNIKCMRKTTVAQLIILLVNYLSELFWLFFLFGQLTFFGCSWRSTDESKTMQWCHPVAQQQPLTQPNTKFLGMMERTRSGCASNSSKNATGPQTLKHISAVFSREEKQRNNQKLAASSSTHTQLLWRMCGGSNPECACSSTAFSRQ